MCCDPFTIVQQEEQFTTADTSMCGVSECAETYFEDLARSLNHVKDLIQGCSSGVQVLLFFLSLFLSQSFSIFPNLSQSFPIFPNLSKSNISSFWFYIVGYPRRVIFCN